MMPKRNNKTIVVVLIVAALIGHLAATQVQIARAAVPVFDKINLVQAIKNFLKEAWRDAQRNAGKIAMREAGRMIRTIIIHAMDGGPAFVTNWRNYSRRNQDAGAAVARNLIGEAAYGVGGDPATATMCEYFREAVGAATNANPVDQAFADISRAFRLDDAGTFKLLTKCTLPKTIIVNGAEKPFDINAFRNNFEGGWEVFRKFTEPQNSYLGALLLSQAEIERQREAQKEATRDEAISGGGFLSTKTTSGQIMSPGKLLGDVAGQSIAQGLDCLNNIESLLELATCAMDVIRNQLTNFRNIARNAGLLDDEASDTGDEHDPVTTPQPPCHELFEPLCTDSTRTVCQNDPASVDPAAYELCFEQNYNQCLAEQCIDL